MCRPVVPPLGAAFHFVLEITLTAKKNLILRSEREKTAALRSVCECVCVCVCECVCVPLSTNVLREGEERREGEVMCGEREK